MSPTDCLPYCPNICDLFFSVPPRHLILQRDLSPQAVHRRHLCPDFIWMLFHRLSEEVVAMFIVLATDRRRPLPSVDKPTSMD